MSLYGSYIASHYLPQFASGKTNHKATLVYARKNYANPSKRAYREIYVILIHAL